MAVVVVAVGWGVCACVCVAVTEGRERRRPCYPTMPLLLLSVAQSCLTLCDPMDGSTPGLPILHHLPEFTQAHVH